MNYDNYDKIAAFFSRHPLLLNALRLFNKFFTLTGFLCYPALLLLLFLHNNSGFFLYILIPGASFLAVSLFRHVINTRRPYERYHIQPLIPREKKGKSFPSRHIFSIFLIASLWIAVSPKAAFLLFLCGIGLAVLRVIGGVHFIMDVLAGAAIGIFCGLLTIWSCTLL